MQNIGDSQGANIVYIREDVCVNYDRLRVAGCIDGSRHDSSATEDKDDTLEFHSILKSSRTPTSIAMKFGVKQFMLSSSAKHSGQGSPSSTSEQMRGLSLLRSFMRDNDSTDKIG